MICFLYPHDVMMEEEKDVEIYAEENRYELKKRDNWKTFMIMRMCRR